MAEKVWFITGTSRGFGREWTIAALERGDKVAATARDTATLDDLAAKYGDALLPIALDVTDRAADFAAVARAHDHFGRLDIVVNNAGYGQFGFIEELSEAEARGQIETNVFGALWITQAALPFLREQRSGHIIQVSSIGGISAFANVGMYHASKWALEGFSQALAAEVASFGIHVTLIEPGGFSTDWAGPSSKRATELRPTPTRTPRRSAFANSARTTRVTRRRRRPPSSRSSTPRSRRCGCSSGGAAADRQGGLREPDQDVGGVAARRRARAGLSHAAGPARRSGGQPAAAGVEHLVVVPEQPIADHGPRAAQHVAPGSQ